MTVSIRFGKHEGKTMEWLFFNNPGYCYWMENKGIHQDSNKFNACERRELERLFRRANHLKIPGECIWCKQGKSITRMAMIMHYSGGLTDVGFDCDDCNPGGSGWIFTRPAFRTPDIFRNYDKTGGKVLVRAIKYAYFGDSSYRMTPKRLEEFWDNDDHFVNP